MRCLAVLLWPLEKVQQRISMRVHQLGVVTLTKTKDNVAIAVTVGVQFKVNDAYRAYYGLSDVGLQIRAYVEDIVRSAIPLLTLDEAFESKDTVASELEQTVQKAMGQYGYDVVKVLITDLQIPVNIMHSMNELKRMKLLREAATQKAEAEKVIRVTRAQADAEVAFLQGSGLARKRQAILDSMTDTLAKWKTLPQIDGTDVMRVILVTSQMEILKGLATQPGADMILDYRAPPKPDQMKMA